MRESGTGFIRSSRSRKTQRSGNIKHTNNEGIIMIETIYRITYRYKGETLIFELRSMNSSDAVSTFLAQCEHERMDMRKLRLIKTREIHDD